MKTINNYIIEKLKIGKALIKNNSKYLELFDNDFLLNSGFGDKMPDIIKWIESLKIEPSKIEGFLAGQAERSISHFHCIVLSFDSIKHHNIKYFIVFETDSRLYSAKIIFTYESSGRFYVLNKEGLNCSTKDYNNINDVIKHINNNMNYINFFNLL